MKKLLIILIMITSYLHANNIHTFSEEEIIDMNKKFKYSTLDKELPSLKESFLKSTGDINFNKYAKEALADKNWIKANYLLKYKKEKGSVVYKGKKMDVNTPEYKKALEYFAISAKKGNILSAYQGFYFIEEYFLYFSGNAISKKYLETFSEVLAKQNYCVGYLYYARTQTKKYGKNPNYSKLYNYLKKGKESCIKENVNKFYIDGLKHELVLMKTMARISKSKSEKK